MSGATGRRNRALKVTCLRSVHVRDARQSSLAKPAGRVGDIARWRRPHHGVRGRDRGIERGLRQARGRRRLELIGVRQPRAPVSIEADGGTRSPVRGLMRQPCPASTSWSQLAAACATACAPPCPDATPATITDTGDGRGCRFPPRLPRIGQETLQRLPQGHRIRCPSRQAGGGGCSRQAMMRTRAWSCRCWSVRVGTRIITTGPRPHVRHIRTTGPCVTRCPASRVTSPRSNQRKAPQAPARHRRF